MKTGIKSTIYIVYIRRTWTGALGSGWRHANGQAEEELVKATFSNFIVM